MIASAAVRFDMSNVVAVATLVPFLFGYAAVFQRDFLPMPSAFPGPLPAQEFSNEHPSAQRPNIVFILSDDHRWDFAGYEGDPVAFMQPGGPGDGRNSSFPLGARRPKGVRWCM